jgi:hypothetical protein
VSTMLKEAMKRLWKTYREAGWIPEPEAKAFFRAGGLVVPRFQTASDREEVLAAGEAIGYPVAAKVVSLDVVHKTEAGGVKVGIADAAELADTYDRFALLPGFREVLVEEMLSGTEVIIGAKVDVQFGCVVLVGIGGTGVEIYEDMAIRMAPLEVDEAGTMLDRLRGNRLLQGFRGAPPVDREALQHTLTTFSRMALEVERYIESIDLNPVMCTPDGCTIADARIMLSERGEGRG